MARPQVHTYHCLCTALVLGSTHALSSLPRRASPSLDGAVILPLPPAPSSLPDGQVQTSELGYSVIAGLERDFKAAIVRREDGFEKRWPWRCARCGLMVGYELDEEHFAGEGKGKGKEDENLRILYVLPGGLMSTDVMAAGKKISEEQVGLGEGGGTIAAFES